jgi:hypothetical protein
MDRHSPDFLVRYPCTAVQYPFLLIRVMPGDFALRPLPGDIYTVSRELGHTSPAMVQRVYNHLGTIRHRSEVVEYRSEQHQKVLAKRPETLAGETE